MNEDAALYERKSSLKSIITVHLPKKPLAPNRKPRTVDTKRQKTILTAKETEGRSLLWFFAFLKNIEQTDPVVVVHTKFMNKRTPGSRFFHPVSKNSSTDRKCENEVFKSSKIHLTLNLVLPPQKKKSYSIKICASWRHVFQCPG